VIFAPAALEELELVRVVTVAVASVPWLLALLVVHLVRKPARPVAGAPTLALGAEPPAIANFLVNGFRPTRDAVPATLLDLAARRFVELQHRGPDEYVCRVKRPADDSLTDYERRVLTHLERRASGGIVPSEALTTGPDEESSRWWNRFKGEVIDDAKRRGLSQDILDKRVFTALGVAAAVPAVFAGAAFEAEVGYAYGFAAFVVLNWVRMRHPQQDTPAGLVAASRWLGVRAKLREDEVFASQSPIAVALWDRHLAYGAALGVAEGTVRRIPMGAESDRDAWSSYGGRWRPVRVEYGRAFNPAWGENPVKTGLVSLGPAAIGAFMLYVLGPPLLDARADVPGAWDFVLVAVVLVPALVFAASAITAIRALADVWTTREVTGQVIRLRRFGSRRGTRQQGHYIAVDDGRSSTIRAWRARPNLVAGLSQGDVVKVSITPRLAYVRSITRLGDPPEGAAVEPGLARLSS
jgi:hypothetical protein